MRPRRPTPPYGMESRQALQNLLPIGTKVSIRTKTVDRYGRSVAAVLKGSTNLHQTLVRTRDTFVFWQHISGRDRWTYSHLKHDARLKGVGGV
jgi:micrococcal nuclease